MDLQSPAVPEAKPRRTGYVRRRLLPLLMTLVVAVVTIFMLLGTLVAAHQSQQPAGLPGTTLPSIPAPGFTLSDQFGRSIALREFRGRVVLLTFFYTHCPDTCPLTAEKLRTVMRTLGTEQRRVAVLIVSTDPLHDTPADARRFLRQHGILERWHFLLGDPYGLARVWASYHAYAGQVGQPAGGPPQPVHTAGMYLIDGRGRERMYLDDSLSATDIAVDLHSLLGDHVAVASIPSGADVGQPAPDFTLPLLTGRPAHLRALRGQIVFLNFWATWCQPCTRELPELNRAYETYRGRGLTVLAIDQHEDAGTVRSYLRAHHLSLPVAIDPDGNVAATYQVYGTPTSLFVDRGGLIRYRKVGAIGQQPLVSTLHRLLSGGSSLQSLGR
ncbi:MAG: redoxin domain-containing protein [Chloroflexi bacterium]|nr:redoxin domain-containing protein [Chloroflexota bacterium]